jgi:hypothetical protein
MIYDDLDPDDVTVSRLNPARLVALALHRMPSTLRRVF